MLPKQGVIPSAGDLPARSRAEQKVSHQSEVLSNLETGLMRQTDGLTDRWTGAVGPAHRVLQPWLQSVLRDHLLFKKHEKEGTWIPKYCLQKEESCDWGDNSNASEWHLLLRVGRTDSWCVFSVCLSLTAVPPVFRELELCMSLEIKTKTGFSGISWNVFSSHWICPNSSLEASNISFSASSDQKQHQQGINTQNYAVGILIHMTRQCSLLYWKRKLVWGFSWSLTISVTMKHLYFVIWYFSGA